MKKWFKEQENRISLFIFLAVMIVACSPLITKLCVNGHDLEYHLLRIESLKEGILAGRPFARINLLYFGGAGYASSLFYPDFLLYIPAVLRVMGVGINAAYHIFVAIVICLTYLSTYVCVKQMTRSAYAGILASFMLICSPYYLGDIYIRGAVGEYTAFIFLPFVLYGIYNVIYEHMDRPWILGIGYAGVLLCHTNTFVFSLLFGLVAFLVKWKTFRERGVFWKLLVMGALSALLTMFYWAPVLEMLLTTPLYVNDAWIGLEQSAMQFSSVFSMTFPSLGFLLVIPAFFRVLIKKNGQNRDLVDFADWLLAGGAIFAILTTDLIPWVRLNRYLSFVQFPWRLFVLATMMLAVADAIILYIFIRTSLEPHMPCMRILVVLLFSIFTILAFRVISNAQITYYDYSEDYYSYKPYTGNVIAGEWLPKTVTNRDALITDSEHMYTDQGDDLAFTRNRGSVEARIETGYAYADVPLIYYKGYQAEIDTGSGKIRLSVCPGNNGLCRVSLDGNTGKLTVKYAGTVMQTISMIVSLLTGLFLIVLLLYKKYCKNHSKQKTQQGEETE